MRGQFPSKETKNRLPKTLGNLNRKTRLVVYIDGRKSTDYDWVGGGIARELRIKKRFYGPHGNNYVWKMVCRREHRWQIRYYVFGGTQGIRTTQQSQRAVLLGEMSKTWKSGAEGLNYTAERKDEAVGAPFNAIAIEIVGPLPMISNTSTFW